MLFVLLALFAAAGALLAYLLVDIFKDIPRSKEIMSPRERRYILSALFGGAANSLLASLALKVEAEDFRKAEQDWRRRFPAQVWWYEIQQLESAVSARVGLRADANSTVSLILPAETTRGDALRAAMAEVSKRWGLGNA